MPAIVTTWPGFNGSILSEKKKIWPPNVGLEPTTLRLRVSCSTDWASRAVFAQHKDSMRNDADVRPSNVVQSWWKPNQLKGFVVFNWYLVECHSVAGVVVSCKIPILATRVRFPGDAHVFFNSQGLSSKLPQCFAAVLHKSARVA